MDFVPSCLPAIMNHWCMSIIHVRNFNRDRGPHPLENFPFLNLLRYNANPADIACECVFCPDQYDVEPCRFKAHVEVGYVSHNGEVVFKRFCVNCAHFTGVQGQIAQQHCRCGCERLPDSESD